MLSRLPYRPLTLPFEHTMFRAMQDQTSTVLPAWTYFTIPSIDASYLDCGTCSHMPEGTPLAWTPKQPPCSLTPDTRYFYGLAVVSEGPCGWGKMPHIAYYRNCESAALPLSRSSMHIHSNDGELWHSNGRGMLWPIAISECCLAADFPYTQLCYGI